MKEKTLKKVLTIAGSDCSGGAGIQADIKTISACGCYAASAITAITVQNTLGVKKVHSIPSNIVTEQIDAVLSDIGADAIKIGMLQDSHIIMAISKCLEKYDIKNIVIDPVMVSTSGHRLIEEEAINTLENNLLYSSRVITPNIPEAEVLCGKKISKQKDLAKLAREISKNKTSVLLKAGHLTDNILTDIFYNVETDEIIELTSNRIDSQNTHGTGCTLSSALASYLAKGLNLNDAARQAKNYINQAILSGKDYKIGNGHGPVNHFWNFY